MELKMYWRIVRRRWWLPIGLAAAVLLFSLASNRPWAPRPAVYRATMRFNVGVQPERIPGVYTYDRYYAMMASEFLVDDLGEVVRSSAFAEAVSRKLAERGIAVPAGAIGASTQPGKLHRIFTVYITWSDEAQLRAIADAVAATLTTGSAEFFAQFTPAEADIRLIDAPTIGRVGRSAREQLDLPLRVLLALTAGVALAFLLDYLDDSVRAADDLERLGLGVIGEIPRR
jgi:capsular polysaccharide biosynthesis protein